MNHETKIAALLKEAAPLRSLPEDDPLSARLAKIVDEINAIRRIQSGEKPRWTPAQAEGRDVDLEAK